MFALGCKHKEVIPLREQRSLGSDDILGKLVEGDGGGQWLTKFCFLT